MFGKRDEPVVVVPEVKPAPQVDPNIAAVLEGVDPEVLAEAIENVAEKNLLLKIEREINEIGKKRAALAKKATYLTHQRERILGQEPSAVAACAK